MKDWIQKKCVPCEGNVPKLTKANEEKYLSDLDGWQIDRSDIPKLAKEFSFESFDQAIVFINQVAKLANAEGHHPDIHNYFKKVILQFHTHAIKGLSDNDFIMAAKINQIDF